MIPYVRSNSGDISAYIDGNLISISSQNIFYNSILQSLRNGDVEEFKKVSNPNYGLQRHFKNRFISLENDKLFYKGKFIDNSVSRKIFDYIKKGVPAKPTILFLERLMANTSWNSILNLYGFLENFHLPITEDGCFLAYKKITADYKDWWTESISNRVGDCPTVNRNEVDDNPDKDCSFGLHVGSLQYAKTYHAGHGRLLIVKVDPANAVSVPKHNHNKMRVCSYEILKEIPLDYEGLEDDLHSKSGDLLKFVVPQALSFVIRDSKVAIDQLPTWVESQEDESRQELPAEIEDWAKEFGLEITYTPEIKEYIETKNPTGLILHLYEKNIDNKSALDILKRNIVIKQLNEVLS